MKILYEDKYLIIVNKEPGWVVQGARKREESLFWNLKNYLKTREDKKREVFLAILHRLDKPVSGALAFAKRSKTAAKFFELMSKGEVNKIYLAKVEGSFMEKEGLLEEEMFIKGKLKKTFTFFKVLQVMEKESVLLLSPLTGRKHQLRWVLAKKGHPIVGDTLYEGKEKILKGKAILLHALYLAFPHPHTQEFLEIWAPVPTYFQWKALDKRPLLEFFNKLKKEKEILRDVSS